MFKRKSDPNEAMRSAVSRLSEISAALSELSSALAQLSSSVAACRQAAVGLGLDGSGDPALDTEDDDNAHDEVASFSSQYQNLDALRERPSAEAVNDLQEQVVPDDDFLSMNDKVLQPSFRPPKTAVPSGVITKSDLEPADVGGGVFVRAKDNGVYALRKRLSKTQCMAQMYSDEPGCSTLKVIVLSRNEVSDDCLLTFDRFQSGSVQ